LPCNQVLSSLAVTAAVLLGFAATGCGESEEDSPSGSGGGVTVFAAASLTEAFSELGDTFETRNDGTEITFSFAASSELAAQIEAGAPADVFASADEANMAKVVDAGLAGGRPRIFAGNVLEIAVPAGNPGDVEGLDDFSNENLLVAVCSPEVPCGNAAERVFRKAGIEASVDSFEADVKSVLTKVELGEVDAGLVYHSDVLAAGDGINSIVIPAENQVVNTYPIVLTEDSGNPGGGNEFIDLILSDTGRTELKRRGFLVP